MSAEGPAEWDVTVMQFVPDFHVREAVPHIEHPLV